MAVTTLAAGLAACQSDGTGGGGLKGLGTTIARGTNAGTQETLNEADLRAPCPQVSLRAGTAFYTKYARSGSEDAKDVVYQASITDTTRSCTRAADGSVTMRVAVAGKVVPGRAGRAGTIALPIRVAVLRSGEVVSSKLHKFPVSIANIASASQFLFDDQSIAIPAPVDGSLQLFVGFDEGSPS